MVPGRRVAVNVCYGSQADLQVRRGSLKLQGGRLEFEGAGHLLIQYAG